MNQRSFGLDAIRVMACFMVIVFHASTTASNPKYFGHQAYDWLFNIENVRMPLFFVLSGYLMSVLYLNRQQGGAAGWAFLSKRMKKIFPMYWMALAIMALATYVVTGGVPVDGFGVLLKTVLLVPQSPADVGGSGAPILFPAWVLQYEMVGYLLVALSMASRFFFGLYLWFWPVANILGGSHEVWWFSFFGSRWLLLFWFGVVLGQYFVNTEIPRKLTLAWCVVWSVLAVAANLTGYMGIEAEVVLLGIGFCGLLLAMRSIKYSEVPSALGSFVRRCSDASYSTFLFHIAVVSVVCRLVGAVGLSGAAGHLSSVVITLVAAVLLGSFVHRHVETRITRLLDRRATESGVAPQARRA